MNDIIYLLDQVGIKYIRYDHPAIKTVEDGARLCPFMPGLHFKNLFIIDKKSKKMYLAVIEENRKFNFKAAKEFTKWRDPSFADEQLLLECLGLTAGAVSPFGLINNHEHNIIVILDRLFITEDDDTIVHFHPNVNTSTFGIKKSDFQKFLEYCGNKIIFEK